MIAGMSDELTCVYRARTVEEGDIVAAWLDARGVAAHVKERHVLGLEFGPLASYRRGVQVCVMGDETAVRARALLVEWEEREDVTETAAGSVSATCEECGATSEFPGAARGSVQDCPHCHQYIDVPE